MTRKMIDAGYQPYKFDAKFDTPFEELINKSTEDLKSFMSGLSEVIMPSMSSTDPLNFETLVWDSLALDMTREYDS